MWLADPLASASTAGAWSWGLGSGFCIKIVGEVAHTDVTSKKEGTEERGATECGRNSFCILEVPAAASSRKVLSVC